MEKTNVIKWEPRRLEWKKTKTQKKRKFSIFSMRIDETNGKMEVNGRKSGKGWRLGLTIEELHVRESDGDWVYWYWRIKKPEIYFSDVAGSITIIRGTGSARKEIIVTPKSREDYNRIKDILNY